MEEDVAGWQNEGDPAALALAGQEFQEEGFPCGFQHFRRIEKGWGEEVIETIGLLQRREGLDATEVLEACKRRHARGGARSLSVVEESGTPIFSWRY